MRQQEIDMCLSLNSKNPLVDEMVVLSEQGEPCADLGRHSVINHPRPTFGDFFAIINDLAHDSDINVLANSDIYLDESLGQLRDFNLKDTLLTLQRWERDSDGKLLPPCLRSDSQDTWIWQGRMSDLNRCDFHLGKPGSDNRIAWEFRNAGNSLINPCRLVRTIHLHNSNVRRYDATETVSPSYHFVNGY